MWIYIGDSDVRVCVSSLSLVLATGWSWSSLLFLLLLLDEIPFHCKRIDFDRNNNNSQKSVNTRKEVGILVVYFFIFTFIENGNNIRKPRNSWFLPSNKKITEKFILETIKFWIKTISVKFDVWLLLFRSVNSIAVKWIKKRRKKNNIQLKCFSEWSMEKVDRSLASYTNIS